MKCYIALLLICRMNFRCKRVAQFWREQWRQGFHIRYFFKMDFLLRGWDCYFERWRCIKAIFKMPHCKFHMFFYFKIIPQVFFFPAVHHENLAWWLNKPWKKGHWEELVLKMSAPKHSRTKYLIQKIQMSLVYDMSAKQLYFRLAFHKYVSWK